MDVAGLLEVLVEGTRFDGSLLRSSPSFLEVVLALAFKSQESGFIFLPQRRIAIPTREVLAIEERAKAIRRKLGMGSGERREKAE